MTQKKRGPGRPPGSKNKKSSSSSSKRKTEASPQVQQAVQKMEMRLEAKAQLKDEILGIILVALGVFLIVALQTSAAGMVGEAISRGLKGMFGFVAFFLPYYFIVYGVLLFLKKTIHIGIKSIIYLVIIYLAIDLVNAGRFMDKIAAGGDWGGFSKCFTDGVTLHGGGVFGMGVGGLITKFMGVAGLYIIAFAIIFVFLLLLVNTPIARFFEGFKQRRTRRMLEKAERAKERAQQKAEEQDALETAAGKPMSGSMTNGQKKIMDYMNEDPSGKPEVKRGPGARPKRSPEIVGAGVPDTQKEIPEPAQKMTKTEAAQSRLETSDFLPSENYADYEFPSVDLLKNPGKSKAGASES